MVSKTLTFHPVIDKFLSLLGRALGEPVIPQQHCDFIGVHQFSGHKGQGAKWHLFIVQIKQVDVKVGQKERKLHVKGVNKKKR